jgi:hypothetical protein
MMCFLSNQRFLNFLGCLLFIISLIFIDLATLIFKQDLYTLLLLGAFNNLFSLHWTVALVQSTLSLGLMACAIYLIRR